MMPDPLRAARDLVRGGRFQEAGTALATVPAPDRDLADWHLLSAMTAWRLGDYAQSRRAALEARARFRARGDADGEMRSDNVAAAGAFGLGDLSTAEEEWSRTGELARVLRDDLMVARCSNNLGNVALFLARHDAAHSFYQLARVGFERLHFPHGVAETWINTAITWSDMRRYGAAAQAAEAALAAAESSGSARLVAEALSSRGEAVAGLGDGALGRTQVERALALARQEGDRLAEPDALRILATIALRQRDFAQATRLLSQALDLATRVALPWSVGKIHRDLGEVHLAAGRRADATRAFEAAALAFDRLGAEPRAAAMRARARETG